jgi:hypothetical protein
MFKIFKLFIYFKTTYHQVLTEKWYNGTSLHIYLFAYLLLLKHIL